MNWTCSLLGAVLP